MKSPNEPMKSPNEPEKDSRLSGGAAAFGMVSLIAGRLGTMFFSFLSTAILARLLTPADFGIVAGAFVVTSLSDAIFGGTFGISLINRRSVDANYASVTLILSLVFGMAIWLLVALSAPAVEAFFAFPNLGDVLTVLALTIPLKALSSPSRSLLLRRHRFSIVTWIALLSYIAGYCVVAVGLAVFGYGVWSLVWGGVSAGVLEAIATFLAARISLRAHLTRAVVLDVFSSSGYFTLAQVLNWAANSGTNVIVGRMLGATPLGIFSRGWKLLNVVVSGAAAPISVVMLPAFSRLQDDLPAARRAFKASLGISLPIFTAASIFSTIHAGAIVRVALGEHWEAVVPIVQLLFLSLVPRCAYKVSDSVIFGFGYSRLATALQAIYALLVVGGSLIGVQYGANGVALAASIAIWLYYVTSSLCAIRLLDMEFRSAVIPHLQGLGLVVPAAVLDVFAAAAFHQSMSFLLAESCAAAIGGTFLLATWWLAPSWLSGSDWALRRGRLISNLKRRLGPRSISATGGL